MKKFLLFFVFTGLLVPNYSQSSKTYDATADAYTQAAEDSALNFGGSNNLLLKSHRDGDENKTTRRGYLKFVMDPVPENESVSLAELNFRVFYSADTLTFNVYSILDDSWEEMTITYDNAPPFADSINYFQTDSAFRTDKGHPHVDFSVDVTEFVKAQASANDDTISLGIYDNTLGDGHIRVISINALDDQTDENDYSKFDDYNPEGTIVPPQLYVETVSTVGIKPGKTSPVNVYSTRRMIHIDELTGSGEYRVRVYNLSGQLVNSSIAHDSRTDMQMTQRGLYVVRVSSGTYEVCKKVLVR